MLNNLFYLLIDFALFGGLILLVGCLALRFFQQPVERLRIIEWTLAGCLLAPLLQQIPGVPRWSLGLWPRGEIGAVEAPVAIATPSHSEREIPRIDFPSLPPDDLPSVTTSPAIPPSIAEPPATLVNAAWQWSWPLAVVVAFAAGALSMTMWLAIGVITLRQISRRSQPAPDRVHETFRAIAGEHSKNIRLAITDRLALPIAFGLLRPTILLPAQLAQTATDAELRFCLAHEYSHVRNSDIRRWRFCTLIGLVFFFQPLYWLIRRQLRLAQDYLADNHAAQTAEPTDYASFLVSLANHRLGLATSVGLSIGDARSNLYRRVKALLEGNPILLRSRRAWNMALVILAILLIGSVSTIRIHAGDDEPPNASDGTKLDSYGDAIPKGAIVRMGTVRLRHTSSLNGVAFSPNGKTIVSCGWDHPVRLWDVETGKPIRQLVGSIDCGSFGAAFSPDGNRLATVGERGLVRLWNPQTSTELWKQTAGSDRIYGVAFSPDAKQIATAGDDGFVRVWDAATGKEVSTLNPQQKPRDMHGVAFSPDGKFLASGAAQGIKIFDLETGREQSILNAHLGEVTSVAFTPDGKHIASGGRSAYVDKRNKQGQRVAYSPAEVKLWNVEDGKLVREFSKADFDGSCAAIAISRDGSLLAEVTHDKIRVWNVATGESIQTISDYYNSFPPRTHAIAISPDNQTVAAIGPHHVVMLWDVKTGERKLPFPDSHLERVESIDCSPKEPIVASGAYDGDVRLWNLHSGKHLRVLRLGEKEPRAVHAVKFSPDGARVAAGGYDWQETGNTGLITVWQVADGRQLWSKVVIGRVTSLDYSRDGKLIAAGAGLGSGADPFSNERKSCVVTFLNADNGEVVSEWKGPSGKVCTIGFSADNSEAIVVDESKTVTAWNLKDSEKSKQFTADAHERQIQSASLSADGRKLATNGSFERLLVVWDVKTGGGIRQIEVPDGKGHLVALSPDGKLLAAGSIDLSSTDGKYQRSIQLWNIDTGDRLGKFDTGLLATSSIKFSRDGRELISGMNDGTLLVWNTAPFLAQAAPTEKRNSERKTNESIPKAENSTQPLTYQCVVQDIKTGKPIEGVKVTVECDLLDDDYFGKSIDVTQHTTDANGKYTLVFPPEQASDKRLYLRLRCEHPAYLGYYGDGYVLPSIEKNKKLSRGPFFQKVELEPGVPITGIIRTPDGKPAANVKVATQSAAGKLNAPVGHAFSTTRTDAEGRFRLATISPGEAELFILPEKDYALSRHSLDERRGEIGPYGLQAGERIRGRVVDADGKPCADVAVIARHTTELNGRPYATNSGTLLRRNAFTDANGEFKMEPVHPGWYSVQLTDRLPMDDAGSLQKHPIPGVFVSQWVKFLHGAQPEPLEIRPVPTVSIEDKLSIAKVSHRKVKGFLTSRLIAGSVARSFRARYSKAKVQLTPRERSPRKSRADRPQKFEFTRKANRSIAGESLPENL